MRETVLLINFEDQKQLRELKMILFTTDWLFGRDKRNGRHRGSL